MFGVIRVSKNISQDYDGDFDVKRLSDMLLASLAKFKGLPLNLEMTMRIKEEVLYFFKKYIHRGDIEDHVKIHFEGITNLGEIMLYPKNLYTGLLLCGILTSYWKVEKIKGIIMDDVLYHYCDRHGFMKIRLEEWMKKILL